MPLLLSRGDLRAFVGDPAHIDDLLRTTEVSLVAGHKGEPSEVTFTGVATADGNITQTFISSGRGRPATLRVFPATTNTGSTRDAWIVLLLDQEGGALLAILAGDDLNPLRTAIPAAVGVRHLAPPGARTIGILGSGSQARNHVMAYVRALPTVERIHVWSPTPPNRERFADEMGARLGIPVLAMREPADAVVDADIVAAAGATRHGQAAADAAWIRPGALFVSMTRSAPPDLEAQLYIPTFNRPHVVAMAFTPRLPMRLPEYDRSTTRELASVIDGERPARDDSDQTIVYELAGPYLWDPPIFELAYRWAMDHGIGTAIELTGAEP